MYSIRLRYIRLWLARCIGYSHHWLTSGWRPPLVLLAAVATVTALGVGLVWLAGYWHDTQGEPLPLWNHPEWWKTQIEWWGTNWWSVISVYALLVLLLWALRAARQSRKRVVVEEFVDHTSEQPKPSGEDTNDQQPEPARKGTDKQTEAAAKGLSTLLVVELARLRDLYRVVNDQRADPWAVGNDKEARAATFTTEDDSGFLKSAVSTESRFSVGPLTIPVGTILNLAGRLAQGPRIVGSLHREGERLILTAQRMGGGKSYSWRVDRFSPVAQSVDQGDHNLDGMVAELACRMFTDLAERGSDSWRAVRAFSNGLRAYRDCLHTPKDRRLKLKRAEREFTEALAEDNNFDLVYYNLGLVYAELGQHKAAKAAFSEAIARNPKRWEAFYALGRVHHYNDKEHESAVQLCQRVISFAPEPEDTEPNPRDTANAYNLKGLALKDLALKDLASKDLDRTNRDFLGPAIGSFKQAVTQSWRGLSTAERRKQTGNEAEQDAVPQLRALASTCLGNLAAAYREAADKSTDTEQGPLYRRAEALLRQAMYITPSEARLYHELGKVHLRQGKYNLAIHELDLAVQGLRLATHTRPAEATFWADLALSYAVRNDRRSQEFAKRGCEKVLEAVDYDDVEGSREALKTAAKAYREVGRKDRADHFATIRAGHFETIVEIVAATKKVAEEVGQGVNNGEAKFPELEAKLENYDENSQEREWAQVSFVLGKLYLAANKPKKAEEHLRDALEKLEETYPMEIAHLKLRDVLSESLKAQNKYAEASQEAEKRGEALQKAEGALGLEPFNPSRHEELGEVYYGFEALEDAQGAWEIALLWNPGNPAVCTKVGRSHYRLIQDCHETDRRKATSQRAAEYLERALGLYGSDQMESKGETHHFLGLLRLDSGEYAKAISHLKVAHALGFTPWVTRLFLGEAYRKNHASNECIRQYRQLIEEVKESIDKGEPVNERVGEESGNPIWRSEILARAYCGIAFEYAERGVKLEDALSHVEEARAKADELEDDAARDRCLAECAGCEGWILYKQDRIDPAIKRLEYAISLNADAESYLHLALAYERKTQKCKDEDQAWFLSTRTRTHCRHAQNTDIKKEYWQDVDELLVRLDKFEAGRNE